jgi:hypothetical protein
MTAERWRAPDWDLAPIVEPYHGIRVNGTDARPTYGFKDYWGRLHCLPWYSLEEAQAAADTQQRIDNRIT